MLLRRWHNFLAPFFAAFLLIIAGTGVAIQVTDLGDKQAKEVKEVKAPKVASSPCDARPARPKRTPIGELNHELKEIHSGAFAGPLGIALGIASGVALLFFAASGFWMYLTMWLRRRRFRV
jgi:glycerol uptake facilitator-like aquaporin